MEGRRRWLNGGKSQIYTDATFRLRSGRAGKERLDKMEICELDITVSSRAGFIRIIFHN